MSFVIWNGPPGLRFLPGARALYSGGLSFNHLLSIHGRRQAAKGAFAGKRTPDFTEYPWSLAVEQAVEERRIITPAEFRQSPPVIVVDARLLRHLDEQPAQILSLKWREFEKLVCTLLEGFGYRTIHSKQGPDGGVDIRAERDTEIGPELVLVQCKRNAPHRKVGAPVVKQLCTDVTDRGATRGLITTTSHFTRVALQHIELKRHRISGADGQKLREWIRQQVGRAAP